MQKISAPVGHMVESVVGCKWSMMVLQALVSGVHRPGQLQRACPGISTKVLNERLRKLERFAMVQRKVFGEVPLRVEYRLTAFGKKFVPILNSVRKLQAELDAKQQ